MQAMLVSSAFHIRLCTLACNFSCDVNDVGSAFGPDYAHHQGTAFGIYTSGFAPDSDTELQADPGIL